MGTPLIKELRELLNRHNAECGSDTPDYILAMYLVTCLEAFDTATQQRDTHAGRDPRPLEQPMT